MTIYMVIIGQLLLGRISIWIMIKNILPNVFVLFRLVNLLLILIHFEHVGQPKPGTKTSRFRPVFTGTITTLTKLNIILEAKLLIYKVVFIINKIYKLIFKLISN